MLFSVVHTTSYRYAEPAMEAYLEVRLTPPTRPEQQILKHDILFLPTAPLSHYTDYFGNHTSFYSMTLRHPRLRVTQRLKVRTLPREFPTAGLALTVAEARQIVNSPLIDTFDYLQPTRTVPVGGPSLPWAQRLIRDHISLGDCLESLNHAIHKEFQYLPGSTENETPLASIWKNRAGVCQDFAHIMLSVLRTAGIPCRYVCGYIESTPPEGAELVGAVATHAWVEVMVPGMQWVALDPTNNQWCGQQHITVSLGRDYSDAAPVRGTFKGSASQSMRVHVTMKRLRDKT